MFVQGPVHILTEVDTVFETLEHHHVSFLLTRLQLVISPVDEVQVNPENRAQIQVYTELCFSEVRYF